MLERSWLSSVNYIETFVFVFFLSDISLLYVYTYKRNPSFFLVLFLKQIIYHFISIVCPRAVVYETFYSLFRYFFVCYWKFSFRFFLRMIICLRMRLLREEIKVKDLLVVHAPLLLVCSVWFRLFCFFSFLCFFFGRIIILLYKPIQPLYCYEIIVCFFFFCRLALALLSRCLIFFFIQKKENK